MKPLGRDDIRVSCKGGDLWEAWVTHAPKSPVTRKPVRRTVHADCEQDAIAEAFEVFKTVYPVLMVTGKLDFKEAIALCIARRRELGQIKSDKTAHDYTMLFERSMKGLPKIPVDEVTKSWLEAHYARLHSNGGSKGEGVSVKTLRKLNVVIKGAYDYMRDQGANIANPAYGVKFPKPSDEELKPMRALTESELAVFLKALDEALAVDADDRNAIKRKAALYGSRIVAGTGIRCGEVCALRRGDVRMVDDQIRISHSMTSNGTLKSTKTPKSMRVNALSASLKQAIIELYQWQATFLSDKQRQSDNTPVCCDEKGNPIRPGYMSAQFKQLCLDAGIDLEKGESIHILRHTYASILLADGASLKAVQDHLGHARSSTTLDLYAHVIPEDDAALAEKFDKLSKDARRAGDYR